MSGDKAIVYKLRSRSVERTPSPRFHPWKKASTERKSEGSGKMSSSTGKKSVDEKPSDEPYPSSGPLMSEAEMYAANRRDWKEWANIALERYNLKEHTAFSCVEVKGLMQNTNVPKRDVHMTFLGVNESQEQKLFFAVLSVPCAGEDPELKIEALACCVLKRVDSGDPNAPSYCRMCYTSLRHPGPRYGFSVESGDEYSV